MTFEIVNQSKKLCRQNPDFYIKNELERLFDDIFKDFPVSFIRSQYDGYPVSNVLVNQAGDFRVEIAATGYDTKDIDVSLDERVLIVRGGIESNKDEKDTQDVNETDGYKYIHHRIKNTAFERRFTLPKELDMENIKVKYKNGLITIDIPFDTEKRSERKLLIE